jgi:hypothetical protein
MLNMGPINLPSVFGGINTDSKTRVFPIKGRSKRKKGDEKSGNTIMTKKN